MDRERKCKNDHLRIHRDGPYGRTCWCENSWRRCHQGRRIFLLATGHRKRQKDWLRLRASVPRATGWWRSFRDIVFLCVRPLQVRDVLLELGHLLTPEKLLVSVAADVSLSALQSQCRSRVARALPSMASERLQGMTLLAFGDNTTIADRRLVNGLFDAIGDAVEVNEKDFGILADLTSSAPGYLAALMSEFVLAAERKAIPAELAERLVKQTLIGTALLLKEDELQGLIASVATKGGITEAGVSVIQRDAPEMFDQLFTATEARHELVKRRLDGQSISE